MGFFNVKKLYYLTSSAFGASSVFVVSTTNTVESTFVESTTTAEESVATSVDAPVPLQAASTASDKIAKIFFIFFCFRLMFKKRFNDKYTKSFIKCQTLNLLKLLNL